MTAELAGRLTETIVIERMDEARTDGGLATSAWVRVAHCRAGIEPEGTGVETEAMALSAMPRFRVTIRPREGIAVGQRVRWRGRMMLVRQRIDDPAKRDRIVLRCEEVRP